MSADRNVLAAAQAELDRRYQTADAAGDWQTAVLLEPLVDVADYLRRIADVPGGPGGHYAADKAGSLLVAARRAWERALLSYAGWPEGTPDDTISEAGQLAQQVLDVLGKAMWATAQAALYREPATVDRDTARQAQGVAQAISTWAAALAGRADERRRG